MKLNHDCVRSVLLYLEEEMGLRSVLFASKIELEEYEMDDILYTVEKLSEAGFLNCISASDLNRTDYSIRSITWIGHQFLDNIRDENVFKEVKTTVFEKVGSASLLILSELTREFIMKKLGL
ncbi:DUF2513 domain-containing protein [Erysipelothrix enhydrae]|uniref:DUF2513 domain-containing protein n=1 Tax=Erysipelothrix enhydrae TaxID=2890314 RepID=UPI002B25362B|nr:DUF2513 domain-containing protein [Erysipelothrix sp. 4322-04]WRB86645.1 DUF2513 domain-containing protein [Erysipelothrix sp. 4322-04]